MALVLMEGFDLLRNTDVTVKYPLSDALSPSMTAGRFGTGQSWIADAGNQNRFFRASLPVAVAAGAVGAGMYIPSATLAGMGTGIGIMNFYDSAGTIQCSVCLAPDGSLSVRRGTTIVLATSATGLFTADAWHYLECEVVIHDTTGRMSVWLNGVQVVTISATDTKNTAVTTFTSFRLAVTGSGFNGLRVDDIYACDTATRLGESRIVALLPTSDTADKDWTPSTGVVNYAMVDEAPVNTTDYIASATVGHQDYYGFEDLPYAPAFIHGVQTSMFAAKDDAATRSIRANLKSGATVANGTDMGLSTSYVFKNDLYLLNPDGGVAWTDAAVAALLSGPEVRA